MTDQENTKIADDLAKTGEATTLDGRQIRMTEIDRQALAAAKAAGMTSPASISDTYQADEREMQHRLEVLEMSTTSLQALVLYIFQTFHRHVDIGKVLREHAESMEARAQSRVLNPNGVTPVPEPVIVTAAPAVIAAPAVPAPTPAQRLGFGEPIQGQ